MGMGFLGPNSIASVYGPSGFYILLPSLVGAREASAQTPGRIQKVDPLMGVPIKYP